MLCTRCFLGMLAHPHPHHKTFHFALLCFFLPSPEERTFSTPPCGIRLGSVLLPPVFPLLLALLNMPVGTWVDGGGSRHLRAALLWEELGPISFLPFLLQISPYHYYLPDACLVCPCLSMLEYLLHTEDLISGWSLYRGHAHVACLRKARTCHLLSSLPARLHWHLLPALGDRMGLVEPPSCLSMPVSVSVPCTPPLPPYLFPTSLANSLLLLPLLMLLPALPTPFLIALHLPSVL